MTLRPTETDTIVEAGRQTVTPAPRRRLTWLNLMAATIMALLFSRAIWLQIIRGPAFLTAAEHNRVAAFPIVAPRGIFFDTRGKQLVTNLASTDVVIDPALLPRPEDETALVERMSELVEQPPPDILRAVQTARHRQRAVVVRRALPHDRVLAVENAREALPGVRLQSSLVRHYALGETAAHILGYASTVAEDEMGVADRLPYDISGKTGLERQYDDRLRGEAGALYREVDAVGRVQKELGTKAPRAGADLTLTLDSELQQRLWEVLTARAASRDEEHEREAAAIIALDPRVGAIRALLSYPAFDPNAFTSFTRATEAAALLSDAREPLFNRATDGTYPPGSTIKPFLAAAGLEEGIVTPATTVLSTGGITVGRWSFPDWKPGGHGLITVTSAIAESVNTFFYILTGGDASHRGLGVQGAIEWLRQFGWGRLTGIDLPTEAYGLLPSPEWKRQAKGEAWYIGDTYHLAIGQGDVLTTPLQVAVATAAIANGGKLNQPYAVERVIKSDGTAQHTRPRSRVIPINASYLKVVQDGMRQAVAWGSGRALSGLSVPIAGKTGTAQTSEEGVTHAWFTSYGPADEPALVVTVLLERGGEGDADAVPVAEAIWRWWIEHRLSSASR